MKTLLILTFLNYLVVLINGKLKIFSNVSILSL